MLLKQDCSTALFQDREQGRKGSAQELQPHCQSTVADTPLETSAGFQEVLSSNVIAPVG